MVNTINNQNASVQQMNRSLSTGIRPPLAQRKVIEDKDKEKEEKQNTSLSTIRFPTTVDPRKATPIVTKGARPNSFYTNMSIGDVVDDAQQFIKEYSSRKEEETIDEGNFFDALWKSMNYTAADLYDLAWMDETAEKLRAKAASGPKTSPTEQMLADFTISLLPTLAATIISSGSTTPALIKSVARISSSYYALTSAAQAHVGIKKVRESGREVSLATELAATIGYAASTYILEKASLRHFVKPASIVSKVTGIQAIDDAFKGYVKKSVNAEHLFNKRTLAQLGYYLTNKETGAAAKLLFKEMPRQLHRMGKVEMFQEISEQTIHNLITSMYDDERKTFQGILESAVFGYLGGIIVGGVGTTIPLAKKNTYVNASKVIDAENKYFTYQQYIKERTEAIHNMSRKDLQTEARKYGLWIGQKPENLRKQILAIETNPNLENSQEIKERHFLVKSLKDFANAHGYKYTDVFTAEHNPEVRKKFAQEYANSQEFLEYMQSRAQAVEEYAKSVTPEEIEYNRRLETLQETELFQEVLNAQQSYLEHVKSFTDETDTKQYLDKKEELYTEFKLKQDELMNSEEYQRVTRIGDIADAAKRMQLSSEVGEAFYHGTPRFKGDKFEILEGNSTVSFTVDREFASAWAGTPDIEDPTIRNQQEAEAGYNQAEPLETDEVLKVRLVNRKTFNPYTATDEELVKIKEAMAENNVLFTGDLATTNYAVWETPWMKKIMTEMGYNSVWISEYENRQKTHIAVYDPDIIEIVKRDVPSKSLPIKTIEQLADLLNPALGDKAPKVNTDYGDFKNVLKENGLEHLYTKEGEPILVRGFYDNKTNTIYINPSMSDIQLVFHEYIHPVINHVKGTDFELYKQLTSAIKDTIYYDKAKAYDNELTRLDEALVEAIADRGSAIYDGKAKSQFQVALKKFAFKLKSILMKLFPNSELFKKMQLNSFIDYMANAIQAGKVITELQTKAEYADINIESLQYLLASDAAYLSRTAIQRKYLAEYLYEKQGKSVEQVWLETGWVFDEATGKFFYDLHSKNQLTKSIQKFDNYYTRNLSKFRLIEGINGVETASHKLKDLMDIEPYIEAYPILKAMEVSFLFNHDTTESALFAWGGNPHIYVNAGHSIFNRLFNYENGVLVILPSVSTIEAIYKHYMLRLFGSLEHEIQHYIQAIEGTLQVPAHIVAKDLAQEMSKGVDIFKNFSKKDLMKLNYYFNGHKNKPISSKELTSKVYENIKYAFSEKTLLPSVAFDSIRNRFISFVYALSPNEHQAFLAQDMFGYKKDLGIDKIKNQLIKDFLNVELDNPNALAEFLPPLKDFSVDFIRETHEKVTPYKNKRFNIDYEFGVIKEYKNSRVVKPGTQTILQFSIYENLLNNMYDTASKNTTSPKITTKLIKENKDFIEYFAEAKGSIYAEDVMYHRDGSPQSLLDWENEIGGIETMALTTMDKIRHKLFGWIDTDSLYLGLGLNVARALKIAPSIRAVVEKEALQLTRNLYKQLPNDLSRERRRKLEQLILHVANNEHEKNSQEYKNLSHEEKTIVDNAALQIREYFSKSYETLHKEGILNREFHVRMADAFEYHADRLAAKDPDDPEIDMYREQARYIRENMHYAHIPYHMLFSIGLFDPTAVKKLQYFTKVKRRVLTYRDLFEPIQLEDGTLQESLINAEEFTIANVMGSYARRLGKDLALSNILKEAKNNGLIRPHKEGEDVKGTDYMLPPAITKHMLHGQVIHQTLGKYLTNVLLNGYNPTAFQKLLHVTKVAAFVEPTFLALYDFIQGVLLGSTTSPAMLVNLPKAIKAVITNSTDYQEAALNGLESKPISNIYKNYMRDLSSLSYTQTMKVGKTRKSIPLAHNVLSWIHGFAKLNKLNAETLKLAAYQITAPLTGTYSLLFEIAWGLDSIMRMNSYYYLRGKGYDSMEAAQTAALYHGDYAAVPAKTRHKLNTVFFTPTFKLVMAKTYAKMAKDLVSMDKDATLSEDARALEGLGRLFALLTAQGILMASLGFKEKEWGRKYSKRVKDITGRTSEYVMTFSHPANMFLKYVERFRNSVDQIYEEPIVNFLKSNRWELNPLYVTLYDIYINNKDSFTGKEIVHPAESFEYKAIQRTKYAIKRLLPILDNPYIEIPSMQTMSKEEVLEYLKNEDEKTLQQLELLLQLPFSFSYLTTPEELKLKEEIDFINSRIKSHLDIDMYQYQLLESMEKSEYIKKLDTDRRRQIQNDLKLLQKRIQRLEYLYSKRKK